MLIEGDEDFQAAIRDALALLGRSGDLAWVARHVGTIAPDDGRLPAGAGALMHHATRTIYIHAGMVAQHRVSGEPDPARGGAPDAAAEGR